MCNCPGTPKIYIDACPVCRQKWDSKGVSKICPDCGGFVHPGFPCTKPNQKVIALEVRIKELEAGLNQIVYLATHAPGAGQASTLQLIENFAKEALNRE